MEREMTTAELAARPGSWTSGQVDLMRVEVVDVVDVVTSQFDMTMLVYELKRYQGSAFIATRSL